MGPSIRGSTNGRLALIGHKYDSQDDSVPGFDTVLTVSNDGTAVEVLLHADHRFNGGGDEYFEIDWAPDGRRLAVLGWPMSFTLDERGRERRRLRTSGLVSQLSLAPDGRHIAYFDQPSKREEPGPGLALRVLDTRSRMEHTVASWLSGRQLRAMGSSITWSPDGSRLVTVLKHAVTYPDDGPANFSRAAHLISLDGTDHGPIAGTEDASIARLSPDGKRIAFVGPGGCPEALYVVRIRDGDRKKIGEISCGDPPSAMSEWAPDSRSVAFVNNRGLNPGVWVVGTDGAGKRDVLRGASVDVEAIRGLSWQPIR